MKKFVTSFLLCALICLAGIDKTWGQTQIEVIRPAQPVNATYHGVFLQQPQFVPSFKGSENSPLSKSEVLSYFDPSVVNGPSFNLITGIGPLIGSDGNPEVSGPPDNSNFFIDGYAMHFSSLLAKPRLDSIKFYFFADSMVNVANNGIVVSVVKSKEDTLVTVSTGQFFEAIPGPNFGVTAIKSLSVPVTAIPNIGNGLLDSVTIKMGGTGTLVPKEFFISLEGTVALSATNIINNKIEFLADSVDLSGTWDDTAPYDTTALRTYYVAFDQQLGYYQTNIRIIDARANNLGIYAPNLYMYAYLHDPTGAVDENTLTGNALAQNYPNAFNASTEINYSLADAGEVSLKVYNALGQEIATIANGYETAGIHQVSFHGENLPSGTYFYTLKSGAFSATKRMVLAK